MLSGKLLVMSGERKNEPAHPAEDHTGDRPQKPDTQTVDSSRPKEIGGRDGPDPTRYGDWEKGGRCIDF